MVYKGYNEKTPTLKGTAMFEIMFTILLVFLCLWPRNILFRWMIMRLFVIN
nr:MAG TPA: hypothetical protein [Caudoviricetes sp.]